MSTDTRKISVRVFVFLLLVNKSRIPLRLPQAFTHSLLRVIFSGLKCWKLMFFLFLVCSAWRLSFTHTSFMIRLIKSCKFLCCYRLKTSNISEVGSASVFRQKLAAPTQIDLLVTATHTLMHGWSFIHLAYVDRKVNRWILQLSAWNLEVDKRITLRLCLLMRKYNITENDLHYNK
jgi:hypothetical protein